VSALDPVLIRGLSAIEPYLGEVVIAGGWVPHIYEILYDALRAGSSPRTRDIDLAVPRTIPVLGESIHELLSEAGFECEFRSLDTPPVTKYVVSSPDGTVEVEFITDAPGSREGVVQVQPDVTAQELHYVALLLENTWPLDLATLTGGRIGRSARIPSPGAFVFHKALVFKERSDRAKREKDLYYAFFVMEAFPEWRGSITGELGALALNKTAWFTRCVKNLKAIFEDPDSAGVTALLNQRPTTAFPNLDDDQFRQYAFSIMSELIDIMENALD
jgi:hypothetical protein